MAKLERNTELRGERYIRNVSAVCPCNHSLAKLARETLYKKKTERELVVYRTEKQKKKKKSERKCNMALPMNWNEVGRHPGCCRKYSIFPSQNIAQSMITSCSRECRLSTCYFDFVSYHEENNV